MFYVLAIALSLAVLFLVQVGTSILLIPVMLLARRTVRTMVAENVANVLLIARLLPLLLTAVITLGLTLPAFLEFEPYSTGEGIGLRLDAMAFAGALLLAGMMWRCWRMLSATRRMQRSWHKNAERIYLQGIELPIYCVESNVSLMAVTGIFRAKIFLSREIAETLSPLELKAALEHEVAHAASFDNLKRMLLKITQPPQWLRVFHDVDREWTGASEIAADCSALARGASVLDLSSALIKVGRLNRMPAASHTVASHLIPTGCSSTLEQRVLRLSELLESDERTAIHTTQSGKLILGVFLGLAAYIACFHAFLPAVHEALEFLVQ